jgi:PAS domain S-box-containing protein
MLEAALDCVITIDHQGRVVEFNPAAERTFGYRREEAVGREMAELIVPAALRARHRDGLARLVARMRRGGGWSAICTTARRRGW